MNPLRVTHVTTHISRKGGGLYESVRHLSQETQKNGIEVGILGLKDEFTDVDLNQWAPLTVHTFPIHGPERFAYSRELLRHLETTEIDIVHLHGVWQFPTAAVVRWSRLTGRPYVVSAHGMLEPWALKRSRFKKAIANWLYQNTCLTEASCLRATALSEVESIRQLGLKNPVALIGNGVFTPEVIPPHPPSTPGRRRRALFISRIHPKKGLLELVHAWAAVQKSGDARIKDWELVIIGPDEGGHLAKVMAAVQATGQQQTISYGGEIWDNDAKMKCYGESDLFVLPSYSENFGLVIAEALGCGVPVITTHPTPWAVLETQRCGWWIETGEKPLEQTLKEALAMPEEELRAMGLRGRELIKTKYSWEPIGKQMAEVYEWLSGRSPKPDTVLN